MRRCLLALALSVLALGAEPAAAAPPKPPAPLEMSGIADVLEAAPLDTIGTTESEDSGVQPVEDGAASSPEQQPGNEAPPAEAEQQSEPDPAAAQPNDSSSDETVVAPAADPSAPQAQVVGGNEPQQAAEPEPAPANSAVSSAPETQQAAEPEPAPANSAVSSAPETQQAAEPEAAPANSADNSPASTSPDVEPQSDNGPSSASPSPASQSAADGQSASRPTASSAPTAEVARAYQVWDGDAGGQPSAAVAAPPPAAGNTAGVAAPEREPDLVPPHAGGLPALLPIELINKIGVDELFGEPVSEPEASPSASAGVAAVSVVRTKEARAGGEAGRAKATSQRAAKAGPGPDQAQQNVRRAAPTRTDLKGAPTARRGPDFIVAAQRAAPGTTMNPDRPPWLITLLALLATAVSLAAITVIVLRPHLFGRKAAPTVPRPREPESSRNEQAGIRYRE